MGLIPRLEGHEPSIPRQSRETEIFSDGDIVRLEEHFEEEKVVGVSHLKDILYRNNSNRQILFSSSSCDVILDKLTEDMEEGEIIKTIIPILGEYPEKEKLFLIYILSSGMADEIRFRFLEEIIFSKSKEFLVAFRKGLGSSSKDLIAELEANPLYDNDNITSSVRAVLEAESDPSTVFPQNSEMYEMGGGGRSLKTTYMLCRESKPLRLAYLKSLLLEADEKGDLLMVLKLVLSHCDVDLKTILQKVLLSSEDIDKTKELKFGDNSLTRENDKIIKLETVNKIENVNLKKFIQLAAFGRTA